MWGAIDEYKCLFLGQSELGEGLAFDDSSDVVVGGLDGLEVGLHDIK